MIQNRLQKCIDWSKIDKNNYLSAMKKSPINLEPITNLLKGALTDDINNQDIFIKGIDYSYYCEEKE